LKTPFFIGTKEFHKDFQKKGNIEISTKIYRLWKIKYSNSCPCGQTMTLRFKSTRGLSTEVINKINTELSVNLGVGGIGSLTAGFTASSQETFRISQEDSIEEERDIRPPECCEQEITIYQLYSRWRIDGEEVSKFFGGRKQLNTLEYDIPEGEYYYKCHNTIDPTCGENCKEIKHTGNAIFEFDGGKISIPAKPEENHFVLLNPHITLDKGDDIKLNDIPWIPQILDLKKKNTIELTNYEDDSVNPWKKALDDIVVGFSDQGSSYTTPNYTDWMEEVDNVLANHKNPFSNLSFDKKYGNLEKEDLRQYDLFFSTLNDIQYLSHFDNTINLPSKSDIENWFENSKI